MKRKSIVFIVLVALVATFVGLTHPSAVHAACSGSISGDYSGVDGHHFTGGLHANKGDVITATVGPLGLSELAIEITNGTTGLTTHFDGATATFVAPNTGTYVANFINLDVTDATLHFTFSAGTDCAGSSGVTQFNFTDGRVNSHDGAQTASVYCNQDGGVNVWSVIDSKGYFAFTATKADLAKVPEKPLKNTLIKSGGGVALYRLTTGELQINSANNYVFIWDGCPAA